MAYIFNLSSSTASNKPKISLSNTTENDGLDSLLLSTTLVEGEDGTNKQSGQFNGVEKEICVVIESVIKWINERTLEEVMTNDEIEG